MKNILLNNLGQINENYVKETKALVISGKLVELRIYNDLDVCWPKAETNPLAKKRIE